MFSTPIRDVRNMTDLKLVCVATPHPGPICDLLVLHFLRRWFQYSCSIASERLYYTIWCLGQMADLHIGTAVSFEHTQSASALTYTTSCKYCAVNLLARSTPTELRTVLHSNRQQLTCFTSHDYEAALAPEGRLFIPLHLPLLLHSLVLWVTIFIKFDKASWHRQILFVL